MVELMPLEGFEFSTKRTKNRNNSSSSDNNNSLKGCDSTSGSRRRRERFGMVERVARSARFVRGGSAGPAACGRASAHGGERDGGKSAAGFLAARTGPCALASQPTQSRPRPASGCATGIEFLPLSLLLSPSLSLAPPPSPQVPGPEKSV